VTGDNVLLPREFWRAHLWWPLAFGLAALTLIYALGLDEKISANWAFDAATKQFPARNAWWSTSVLHSGGRALIWLVALSSLALVVASRWQARLAPLRAAALYVFITIGLTTALIGLLKSLSPVHCPWDLADFGGKYPHSLPWQSLPGVQMGKCFPGAHAGSGFALFCLYFATRDRWPSRARACLAFALLVGATFAFSQEARGAHFLSHDLSSALIAWLCCLGAYVTWQR
jgi:membrane-associated PAP2 superfamily phosphatase